MGQAHRFSGPGKPYEGLTTIRRGKVDWAGKARLHPEMLEQPLKWKRPRRIFVNSMSDLFHESLSNEDIAAVFGVMAACPQHTFQVLTKRPHRMLQVLRDLYADDGAKLIEAGEELAARMGWCHAGEGDWSFPLPNFWLGVSAENQATVDERIPLLLKTPAAVRFVSAEPLLETIDLRPYLFRGDHRVCPKCLYAENTFGTHCPNDGSALGRDIAVDWVIVGGESGPSPRTVRPCALEWIEGIVNQCRESDVACFVKQLGSCVVSEFRACDTDEEAKEKFGFGSRWLWRAVLADRKGGDMAEWPDNLCVREFPNAS